MISQLTSLTTLQAATAQQQPSSPVVNVDAKTDSSVVLELPVQAVKALDAATSAAATKQAAEQINDFLKQYNNNLQFSVDESTGKNIIRVIDASTEEVIRQVPTEEVLVIARALDKLQGLLLREQA